MIFVTYFLHYVIHLSGVCGGPTGGGGLCSL